MNDPIVIGAFATICAAVVGAIATVVAALICNLKALVFYHDVFLKIAATPLKNEIQ